MGVRVKIKVRSLYTDREVITVGLLNSGYETEEPECIIPVRLAEELGIWPELPKGARVKSYETTGGPVRMYCLRGGAEITVIAVDVRSSCKCDLAISEIERGTFE